MLELKHKKPNQCTYCYKQLSTKRSLQRHHNICKIKNGGHDKLIARITAESDKSRIAELEAKLKEREEQMNQMAISALEEKQEARKREREKERIEKENLVVTEKDDEKVENLRIDDPLLEETGFILTDLIAEQS